MNAYIYWLKFWIRKFSTFLGEENKVDYIKRLSYYNYTLTYS